MPADVRSQLPWRRIGPWPVLVYFAAGLVAIDALVGAGARTWRSYDPVFYRDRLRHCRGHQWDLVVVGGSPAMAGIDTDLLGGLRHGGRRLERAYNLCLPLGTSNEVLLAVEDGLRRPPALLVYGITASDLNDSRVEPQGPRYLMRPADVVDWARRRPLGSWWCLRHYARAHLAQLWKLYQNRDGIRLWAADHLDRHWPGLCNDAAHEARTRLGYSQTIRTTAGMVARRPVPPHYRLDQLKIAGKVPPFPFLDEFDMIDYRSRLEGLLAWAHAHHVEIVLVDLPVPADLDTRLHPHEFAAYRALLRDVEKTRGVPVLRASRDTVGLADSDFGDLIHLNGDGAAKFSTWLRQQLEAFAPGPGNGR